MINYKIYVYFPWLKKYWYNFKRQWYKHSSPEADGSPSPLPVAPSPPQLLLFHFLPQIPQHNSRLAEVGPREGRQTHAVRVGVRAGASAASRAKGICVHGRLREDVFAAMCKTAPSSSRPHLSTEDYLEFQQKSWTEPQRWCHSTTSCPGQRRANHPAQKPQFCSDNLLTH